MNWVPRIPPVLQSLDRVRQAYVRESANSRWLPYALPALLLILALYVVDVLSQANRGLAAEYAQLASRETRVLSVGQQADWSEVSQQAQEKYRQLEARFWSVESLELASADMQMRLRSIARDRIEALRIAMAPPRHIETTGVWQLSAEVTGRLTAGEVPGLLFELASADPAMVVDRFNYAPGRSRVGLLQVSAYIQLPQSGPESTGEEG